MRLGTAFQNRFLDSLRIENLRVEVGPDVWLRSNEAEIQLEGEVQVSKLRREYIVAGDLNTPRGEYTLDIRGLVSRKFIIDHGTVRRQVHKKLRGIRAADDAASPITDADIAVLNRRHNNVMMALCGALFLLVAGGLMLDISKSNLDLGERAHQLVQNLMKPSSEVQRAGQQ